MSGILLPCGRKTGLSYNEFAIRNDLCQPMVGYIERVSSEIAALIAPEGLDYNQTKAVFKAARRKAGLKAPKEHWGSPARLTLEEELLFIQHAYARSGQVGVMNTDVRDDERRSETTDSLRQFSVAKF